MEKIYHSLTELYRTYTFIGNQPHREEKNN